MKTNWVNAVLDAASRTVRAWPAWMQRPEVRTPGGAVVSRAPPRPQAIPQKPPLPPPRVIVEGRIPMKDIPVEQQVLGPTIPFGGLVRRVVHRLKWW